MSYVTISKVFRNVGKSQSLLLHQEKATSSVHIDFAFYRHINILLPNLRIITSINRNTLLTFDDRSHFLFELSVTGTY